MKYTDEELLAQRLAGILPRIDIAGEPFIIDWRLKELRDARDPSVRIDLHSLPMDETGEQYLFFYNTRLKKADPPDPKTTRLPDDVVLLKIPYEMKLDPVGVAREYGLPDKELLERFPIQRELKVAVIPLDQTELVQLVKRNRDKQRLLGLMPKIIKRRAKGRGL